MVSKSQISLIKSLQQKKFRREHGLFVAEGYKSVNEFLSSGYQIHTIYHTPAITAKLHKLSKKVNFTDITAAELEKMSSLTTPQEVLAVIHLPKWPQLQQEDLKNRSMACKTPATWAPLYEQPIGLASKTSFVRKIP
jgi:TrmH family RNA methyltransferase